MRAEITATGTLVLYPESGTEAFAVTQWHAMTRIDADDPARGDKCHLRCSAVQIDLSKFPETLAGPQ